MEALLQSIVPGVAFNILRFGSSFERLWPESRVLSEETQREALAHVASIQADLGGTELLSPLQQIFSAPSMSGRSRQLFILTEGCVSDTDGCISQGKQVSYF